MPMTFIELAVLALATWRLSSLLVTEVGPFIILERFRYLVGVRYDPTSTRYGKNEFAKLFICLWCLSVWIGIILSLIWWLAPTVTFWLCLPFALSGVAVFLQEVTDHHG